MAKTEECFSNTVEEMGGVLTDLIKRLAKTEKENISLRRKLGDYEHRLSQIEDMLTADPDQLAAIRTATKRLRRDVIEGLPQHTQIGDYWKEVLLVIYRKGFKKSLRDRGLRDEDRGAIIEVIGKIMINPFYPGLETEIRHNGDNGNASIIAGIARKTPYYYSRVGGHRRILYAIEGTGKNQQVHFIETNPKENYTYA